TLHQCAEAIACHLGGALARIWTRDGPGGALRLEASAGPEGEATGASGAAGQEAAARIAAARQLVLSPAAGIDSRLTPRDGRRRQGWPVFAGYPLLVDDQVVGVLALFARRPLSTPAIEALASAADALAPYIRYSWTREALEQREASLRALLEN